MTSPEVYPEVGNVSGHDDLVEVAVYPTFSVGSDHGLVVLAMGLPYWLAPRDDQFGLWVERPAESAVRVQLAKYERESVGWPPRPIGAGSARPAGIITPLLWALAVLAAFWSSVRWPELVARGALNAEGLVQRREWWRPFTALFLHADVSHLAANLIAGVFIFSAITAAFGRGRGWWLLLVASVLGNVGSAAGHYPAAYVSIGASTAIFAGLGLLTARAVLLARSAAHPHVWRSMLVPLGAGCSVLALFGAGAVGDRVDVGAHVCGFLAGCAVALIAVSAFRGGARD